MLARVVNKLLVQHQADLAAAAAATSALQLSSTAAYSNKTFPGPRPVQSTGGGDRPSTNDDTRDLGRYGEPMSQPGPTAVEAGADEIRRAEAGEPVFTPYVDEEEDLPDWKKASMLPGTSQRNDPRAQLPSDSNRRWMSADDLGTRVNQATEQAVTPRWPKPGLADELGTSRRAGAPMDASTSAQKPHATATTSQFGGNPVREMEIPAEELKQGKAIPNEAAQNQ